MEAARGALFAKVGAEGVYSAVVPSRGWGIAVKVEDGDWRAAPLALQVVLERLSARIGPRPGLVDRSRPRAVSGGRDLDTRNEPVGAIRAAGTLEFSAS